MRRRLADERADVTANNKTLGAEREKHPLLLFVHARFKIHQQQSVDYSLIHRSCIYTLTSHLAHTMLTHLSDLPPPPFHTSVAHDTKQQSHALAFMCTVSGIFFSHDCCRHRSRFSSSSSSRCRCWVVAALLYSRCFADLSRTIDLAK